MTKILADAIAARRAAGLTVRTTLGGHTAEQHFDTATARDAYVARARRAGAEVVVS